MRKEIGSVAVIGTAPDKENLNTASLATTGDGDDIGIGNLGQIYVLIGLNAGKGTNPVTPDGGAFKIQLFSGIMHAGCIFTLNIGRVTIKEMARLCHLFGVIFFADQSNAWT